MRRFFRRCDSIPLSKEAMWRIERGVVRSLTYSEDGLAISLGYLGQGDVIGAPLSCVHPYHLECLTQVEVSVVPEVLRDQIFDTLCLQIQQTEELLSIALQSPISLRLWKLLVWLGKKFGRQVEQGCLIDVELTHQHLAEAINTTRVTVTRLLGQFEKSGKLLRHKRRLILAAENSL
jgi:CRP-like cAMP-binding protein